ncbi:hypothetical protein F5Y15DRAFT_28593 [Xylariaceae sp. FL0016]|nr:hypothetical protein F5Y15DRAFT_28593 [Xylariaceae sp. FL0016]
MAGGSPRSVADATRFTSNTPHADTKSKKPTSSSSTSTSPRTSTSRTTASGRPGTGSPSSSSTLPPPGMPRAGPQETIEERVRRLRAAHLAAKKHSVSRFDRVVDHSRKYFDAAHKFTVMGLIGFSGLALLVTVYATADMMMYNRKRRNEFFALQKQLKEDSLEAARLAYMTGTASEEQIALVEDATDKARSAGLSLPSLLSAPTPPASWSDSSSPTTARSAWPGESMTESNLDAAQKKGGIVGWLFGGLKKEERRPDDAPEFTREEDPVRTGSLASNVGDKAKSAFETERENQRRGGPLDQLGLQDKSSKGEEKKGWFGW